MTARGKEAAALALHRFGFGPAGHSIAAIAADPQGALLADLERPQAGLVTANLPSSGEAARAVFDFRAEAAAKQKLAQRAKKDAEANTPTNASLLDCSKPTQPCVAPAAPPSPKPLDNKEPPLPQQLLQNEAKARFDAARAPTSALPSGWSGSGRTIFAFRPTRSRRWPAPLSAKRSAPTCSAVSPTCCKRSRAIRPCCSISTMSSRWAPDSTAGINRDKGLNENLAREILELHTLGVRSGYTPGRCHELRQCAHRLDLASQPGEPQHGGEFAFVQAPS